MSNIPPSRSEKEAKLLFSSVSEVPLDPASKTVMHKLQVMQELSFLKPWEYFWLVCLHLQMSTRLSLGDICPANLWPQPTFKQNPANMQFLKQKKKKKKRNGKCSTNINQVNMISQSKIKMNDLNAPGYYARCINACSSNLW